MRSILLLLTAMPLLSSGIYAQQKILIHKNEFIDITGTAGKNQGSIAGSYVYNWRLGEKRKFEIGAGVRYTGYSGTRKDFITAPAKLARTNTIPFLIVFAGQQEQNFDTLTLQRPFTNMVNLTANFGYHITKRLYGGMNIDVIGFTFGRNSNAVFTSNGMTVMEPVAKPVPFNLLLTGDLDKGSLNSEFFLKYSIGDRWSIKGVYQFLFVEYETTTTMQTAPDGTSVKRFRNKANNAGIGVSYSLK